MQRAPVSFNLATFQAEQQENSSGAVAVLRFLLVQCLCSGSLFCPFQISSRILLKQIPGTLKNDPKRWCFTCVKPSRTASVPRDPAREFPGCSTAMSNRVQRRICMAEPWEAGQPRRCFCEWEVNNSRISDHRKEVWVPRCLLGLLS